MKNLLVITAVAATLSISACANNAPVKKSAYESTVFEAMKTHESAKSHHHVFKQKKMKQPYVEHYLALAKKAKAEKDDKLAMQHAKAALKIAKAEIIQYEEGKNFKPGWIK